MIEQLQSQLRAIIAHYKHDDDNVSDADVVKFINCINEYDDTNDNNCAIHDALIDSLNIVNADQVSDIARSCNVARLYALVSSLDDIDAEYYSLNDYEELHNITAQDLRNFIDDLDYAK